MALGFAFPGGTCGSECPCVSPAFLSASMTEDPRVFVSPEFLELWKPQAGMTGGAWWGVAEMWGCGSDDTAAFRLVLWERTREKQLPFHSLWFGDFLWCTP